MSESSAPPPTQATPTTAPDTPAALVTMTFEIACVDGAAVIHFFSATQPPVAVHLKPDLLGELIGRLQDAKRQLQG